MRRTEEGTERKGKMREQTHDFIDGALCRPSRKTTMRGEDVDEMSLVDNFHESNDMLRPG
jgi:hypothetical protein